MQILRATEGSPKTTQERGDKKTPVAASINHDIRCVFFYSFLESTKFYFILQCVYHGAEYDLERPLHAMIAGVNSKHSMFDFNCSKSSG